MQLTSNPEDAAGYLTPRRARSQGIDHTGLHPLRLFEIEKVTRGSDRGFRVKVYTQAQRFLGWLREPEFACEGITPSDWIVPGTVSLCPNIQIHSP